MRASVVELLQHNLAMARKEMVNVTDHFMVERLINKMADMNIALAIFMEPITQQESEQSKKVDDIGSKLSNLSIGTSAAADPAASAVPAEPTIGGEASAPEEAGNNATTQQQQPRRWTPRCYYCGKQGHRMRHCFCFSRKIKEIIIQDQEACRSIAVAANMLDAKKGILSSNPGHGALNDTPYARRANGGGTSYAGGRHDTLAPQFSHLFNNANIGFRAPHGGHANGAGGRGGKSVPTFDLTHPGVALGPRQVKPFPPYAQFPTFVSANSMRLRPQFPTGNLMAPNQRFSQQHNFNARNIETFGEDAARMFCKTCECYGHLSRYCPSAGSRNYTRARQDLVCFKCNKIGHTAPYCLAKKFGGGKGSGKTQREEGDKFLTDTESSTSIEAIGVDEEDLNVDDMDYLDDHEDNDVLLIGPNSSKDKGHAKKSN